MLKRKFLAAVLPVVAAATVVGSGFSAWYFGDFSSTSKDGGVGISIEGATEGTGSFEVYYNSTDFGDISGATLVESETFELNLDQGTGNDRLTNPDKGISFKVNTGSGSTKTSLSNFTIRYKINKDDKAKLDLAGLKLQYTFEISLNDVLDDYVIPQSAASSESNDYAWSSIQLYKDTSSYKYYSNTLSEGEIPPKDIGAALKEDEVSGYYYFDISFNVSTDLKEKNTFLKYNSKPEELALYETMRAALKNEGLIENKNTNESAGAGTTKGITFKFAVSTDEN